MNTKPKLLPPSGEIETQAILRKTASAHRYLAKLKGISKRIPNQSILINTLALQEAKDSSAIENIITTHDDLFLGKNRAGFRKLRGTKLKNDLTGQTVYVPQHPVEIVLLLKNLERFINDDSFCAFDPLVKMAIIHHQFKSSAVTGKIDVREAV